MRDEPTLRARVRRRLVCALRDNPSAPAARLVDLVFGEMTEQPDVTRALVTRELETLRGADGSKV